MSAYYNRSKHLLRALRHRNYRLFFAGRAISLIGTWMQQVAVSWPAYRMTHSAFLLGILGFSMYFPIFLFTIVGGVYSDRWNRRRRLRLQVAGNTEIRKTGLGRKRDTFSVRRMRQAVSFSSGGLKT
jgi:MFS family permease